ncbi:hypothetical protein [Maridesulfovibrio bastinii]|jgi:hypothetical protein|uniref:hypothetical protein n=1 Tax=Maridesulfovibrio bastinii TaxID=47157 RepID=UPI0003F99BEC|nr:hypothetical protein [Maridesulfovibrio bastinii]
MIDKVTAVETVIEKLQKLSDGHSIDLRSYKRDRSLIFVKINNREILILEDGYEKKKHIVSLDVIRRKLKNLIKKEFPRSRKLRLYSLGQFDESLKDRKLKKI